jgi:hypothetical protein
MLQLHQQGPADIETDELVATGQCRDPARRDLRASDG